MLGRFSCILLAASLLAACHRSPEASTQRIQAVSTNRQVFEVHGTVLAIHPKQKTVEIKHEAVPGYMPAMSMPFDVKDTNELAGLEPGEPVIFRLTVTDTEGWIDQIRRTAAGTNSIPTTGPFRLVREVQPLEVGDILPEYHLTNQFNQPFSTTDFKGKALAITFLFTRCPYPNFCPRMANSFEEAQHKLSSLANGPTNWHLLTVSFDPDFDRPEVLKVYAQSHNYDPAHWSFATGTLIDITALGEQFGLSFWHDQTGSISHNLRTVVIDAAGRVQKILPGNDWTSDELVAEMVKASKKAG